MKCVAGSALAAYCKSVFSTRARAQAGGYAGSVRFYVADLKPSFPEHKSYSRATALTAANYRRVLDGLKTNAGANGVRLPIIPGLQQYSSLYQTVYAYARSLGLTIYASPLSVGFHAYAGWTDDQYAAWLTDYANAFRPDVLSPFNEAGIDDGRMVRIVGALKSRLASGALLAGPDRQHVAKTLEALSTNAEVIGLFDIVDSHNADRDASATLENWSRLVQAAGGKPVWSSENPTSWDRGRTRSLPGIDQAVSAGVQGIVVWMAKPTLVDDGGRPTQKASEIAARLSGKS